MGVFQRSSVQGASYYQYIFLVLIIKDWPGFIICNRTLFSPVLEYITMQCAVHRCVIYVYIEFIYLCL